MLLKSHKYFGLLLSLYSFLLEAKDPLLFIVNYPGSPPYIYQNEKEGYRGIIPDILNKLTKDGLLHIRYISNSRKRSEEYMYQGKADLMLLSQSWLKYPEKLIATIPIYQHRSFLFKTKEFLTDFSLNNIKDQQRVCTRQGYRYPNLSPYFTNKKLVRVDSSSHITMIKMLFKHRCDLVIINEFNAISLMKATLFKEKKLFRSPSPISIVPLNIILRAELTKEKTLLDDYIKSIQDSGELKQIFERHTIK